MSGDILRGLFGQYNLLGSSLVTERKVMFFQLALFSDVQRVDSASNPFDNWLSSG